MDRTEIICLRESGEKQYWQKACAALWLDVFGDAEQFVGEYMASTWRENQVLLLPESESSVASMLHVNPYTLNVRGERLPLYYLVGVATREELRGRGYMRMLLKEALRMLRAQGEPFTYLMPASVRLYTPYGFVPAGYAQEVWQDCDIQQAQLQAAEEPSDSPDSAAMRLIPYGELSDGEKETVSRFVEDSRQGIYVLPDTRYLCDLERQAQSYQGELLTAWLGKEPVGMAAYLYEEGEAEIAQTALHDVYGAAVCDALHRHIGRRFSLERLSVCYDALPDNFMWCRKGVESVGIIKKRRRCITMLRCLDAVWFLQRLSRPDGWDVDCIVAVTDEILAENNGSYHVVFAVGQEKNHVEPDNAGARYCLSVETLVQYWLNDTPVYMPELI